MTVKELRTGLYRRMSAVIQAEKETDQREGR